MQTMSISFDVEKHEADIIQKIAKRAVALARSLPYGVGWDYRPLEANMDITACHANGCPLRLSELLEADDFNFAHDILGIRRHISRNTGKLGDSFVPRFAKLQDTP